MGRKNKIQLFYEDYFIKKSDAEIMRYISSMLNKFYSKQFTSFSGTPMKMWEYYEYMKLILSVEKVKDLITKYESTLYTNFMNNTENVYRENYYKETRTQQQIRDDTIIQNAYYLRSQIDYWEARVEDSEFKFKLYLNEICKMCLEDDWRYKNVCKMLKDKMTSIECIKAILSLPNSNLHHNQIIYIKEKLGKMYSENKLVVDGVSLRIPTQQEFVEVMTLLDKYNQ